MKTKRLYCFLIFISMTNICYASLTVPIEAWKEIVDHAFKMDLIECDANTQKHSPAHSTFEGIKVFDASNKSKPNQYYKNFLSFSPTLESLCFVNKLLHTLIATKENILEKRRFWFQNKSFYCPINEIYEFINTIKIDEKRNPNLERIHETVTLLLARPSFVNGIITEKKIDFKQFIGMPFLWTEFSYNLLINTTMPKGNKMRIISQFFAYEIPLSIEWFAKIINLSLHFLKPYYSETALQNKHTNLKKLLPNDSLEFNIRCPLGYVVESLVALLWEKISSFTQWSFCKKKSFQRLPPDEKLIFFYYKESNKIGCSSNHTADCIYAIEAYLKKKYPKNFFKYSNTLLYGTDLEDVMLALLKKYSIPIFFLIWQNIKLWEKTVGELKDEEFPVKKIVQNFDLLLEAIEQHTTNPDLIMRKEQEFIASMTRRKKTVSDESFQPKKSFPKNSAILQNKSNPANSIKKNS